MTIYLGPGEAKEVNVALQPRGLDPDPPDDEWPAGYFTLYGYVTGHGLTPAPIPVEGAGIYAGLDHTAKSDANGYYVHRRCPDLREQCPDGWGVRCYHQDYRDQLKTIYHAAGEIVRLDFDLMAR